MKHKSITILLCIVLGNIIACVPAPITEYALFINSTGGGSVTTPGEGTFNYDKGTVVNLVAVADEYYPFRNWTGDADTIANVNEATTTITMNDNYAITANFAQSPVKTYSKYNFSFEYPKDFSVTESGNLESEANDNSGIVQVSVEENGDFETFTVGWMTVWPDEMESIPGGLQGWLEDALEILFEEIESEPMFANVEEGDFVEATKAEHPIFYQDYTITTIWEYKMYGVASCFYCDKSLRLFQLEIFSSEEDVLGDFWNYLDSFVCH